MGGARLSPTPPTTCPPPIISFAPAIGCFALRFRGRGQIRYIGASSLDDPAFVLRLKLPYSPGGLAATGLFFVLGPSGSGFEGTRLAAGRRRPFCQAGSFSFHPSRGAADYALMDVG